MIAAMCSEKSLPARTRPGNVEADYILLAIVGEDAERN